MLHFYSGQVRRFLTQFMRILNNFSVETGRAKDDEIALRPVSVVYGDATRQVSNIIRNNSENALNYAPKIACYIRELNYDRERMQNPYHVEKQHLREREQQQRRKLAEQERQQKRLQKHPQEKAQKNNNTVHLSIDILI